MSIHIYILNLYLLRFINKMTLKRAKNRRTYLLMIAFALFSLLLIYITAMQVAAADPTSPTALSQQQSSTFNTSRFDGKNTTAMAGNVTELSLTGTSPTEAWQGYYGNITGTITLEDSTGNVFYNWSVAEPEGEIYASINSSITWSNIECFNYTANGSLEINLTLMEAQYNIGPIDDDGINETFNDTIHPTLYVGSRTINSNTCPSTHPFTNAGRQSAYFHNLLLTDNQSLVFTTIIENDDTSVTTDVTGYNGGAYDFQMLVAEDGHDSDITSTVYYFWVEIT